MRVVTIDFETYYDKDYSLTKLSTEAYVRNPRFVVHGAALKHANEPAQWYDAQQLKQALVNVDWKETALIGHHLQFDGLILSHHYRIVPKLYLDTLSMARLLLGNHLSVSLDSVRQHFGLSPKRTPYDRFKGLHWYTLDQHTRQLLATGCCDEVESIYTIFTKLARDFPTEEYEVVDLTIRMFTEPCLRADVPLLAQLWEQEERAKRDHLLRADVRASDVSSARKFSALLADEGVEVATKNGKNGVIPAFAKTDEFMRELLDHEIPRVRRLAQARLGIRSTLLQTRAETLGYMAQRGPLAVYLRYCGAHTTRWSGGDRSNFQNFRRDSSLRRAILAPANHLLATVDLSQIECRILNYLAGQTDVLERFRNGEDPYTTIASEFYGRPITKADVAERGTGKQTELSCGYGCGAKRFQQVARLGLYGPPIALSELDAGLAVTIYRRTHDRVVAYWRAAESVLPYLAGRLTRDWGPLQVEDGRIWLPNGTALDYRTLTMVEGTWQLQTRIGWTKLYGAKLVENVVQALARVVMSQACLRIKRAGFRPVLSSHDEWSFLVPDDSQAQPALDFIKREMVRVPDWLPGIPLDCEGTLGERYAK